jgi:hypothetical protein
MKFNRTQEPSALTAGCQPETTMRWRATTRDQVDWAICLAPKAKPAPGIIKVREVSPKALEGLQVRNAVRPFDHDDVIAREKVGQAGIPHFQGWVAQPIAVNVL